MRLVWETALPLSFTMLRTGGSARGKIVKPETWRIVGFADVISMTTGPLSSCKLPLTNRDPNDLTEAFPLPKKLYLILALMLYVFACLSNKFAVQQINKYLNFWIYGCYQILARENVSSQW